MVAIGKVSGPEFIATPPLHERGMRPVPKMDGVPKFDTRAPDARRVIEADFVSFGLWLVPKLTERYQRPPESIVGYLKQVSGDRFHGFFRHTDAALLMYADVVQLETRPLVREVFAKIRATKAESNEARKAQHDQLIELYRLAYEWAKSIKACAFRYGEESDLPLALRYDAIPNSKKQEYNCAQI